MKKPSNSNIELKKRSVSTSIGKFNSNKLKKNRKVSPYSKLGSKSLTSNNIPIDKKSLYSSTFSTCAQSINQFYNNNNYSSKNNKNLADVLNEIINSKFKSNNIPLKNFINKKNNNNIIPVKKSLSPSNSLNDLLKVMKMRFSKNYIDTLSYRLSYNIPSDNRRKNISSLEKMIKILNDYGKEKFEQQKLEKIEKKKEINYNIEKLTSFLKVYKLNKKKNDYENFKLEKKINTLLFVSQKYSDSEKELKNVTSEIESIFSEINYLNSETIEYNKLYNEEENKISELKQEIAIVNKVISDVKKDIEMIIPGINYLNKHVKEIKTKISTQEHFNSNFFLNMVNVIEKVNLN